MKDCRCVKLDFPVGDADPHSLTLNIPALELSIPEVIPQADLGAAYSKLRVQGIDMECHIVDHGAYPESETLPSTVTEQEAIRKFDEALGYVYKGPWEISVSLNP